MMQLNEMRSPALVGGRISSPKFRENLNDLDDYIGLEEDIDRFYVLKLVKQAGRDAGFSSELIELLEYYVVRTSEVDWIAGSQPINYQSVTSTAQDLDISERQVRNRERALHALGAITWHDSGNFKRYGMRDKQSGHIKYAFGVDLSPLASLVATLEEKIALKKESKALWNETKRKISAYRARIRALLAEAALVSESIPTFDDMSSKYEGISYSIRTYHSQEDLETLLAHHKVLFDALYHILTECSDDKSESHLSYETSSRGENHFRHIQRTNNKLSNKLDYSNLNGNSLQKGVAEPAVSNIPSSEREENDQNQDHITQAISKITWKQVLNACSERFKDHIPLHERALSWQDLTDSAYALLPELGIHKSAWWDACSTLGRTGATICIMIIDQKMHDAENPIKSPGGYLREMTARAKNGELNLQGSVFGLLKRSQETDDS